MEGLNMRNRIDFEWTKESEYFIVSLRKLIAMIYNIADTNVYPLSERAVCEKEILHNEKGLLKVRFNSFEDYLKYYNYCNTRRNEVIIPADLFNDIINFFKKYVPKFGEEDYIYAEPDSDVSFSVSKGYYYLNIRMYRANGFYSMEKYVISEWHRSKQTVQDVRNNWLELNKDNYELCYESTETIDAICEQMYRISNTYEGTKKYFDRIISKCQNLGYNMCAYRVIYSGTDKVTNTFAYTAEDILKKLDSDFNNQVCKLEVIGFCNGNMENGERYFVIFEDNTVIPFYYTDMKSFSKIIAKYVNKGVHFRVSKEV